MLVMEKVFGIGFSKTGTTSLEDVFETLGYNTCKGHWNLKHNDYLLSLYVNKDYNEIYKMTQYWDAYADGPWGGGDLYKKLYEWYPDAKFILTYREPEKWYESFYQMLTKFDDSEEKAMEAFHINKRYGTIYFFKHIFKIDNLKNNKQQIVDYYVRTNKEIEIFFDQKKNFLKIDLTKEKQHNPWEIICDFLEKSVPDIPFPHSNKGHLNTGLKNKPSLKDKVKHKMISIIKKI